MIKGCNRRVIVVKHPDSESFEEAYFIVREGKFKKKSDTPSLVGEATRLINGGKSEAFDEKKQRRSSRIALLLSFLAGAGASFLFFYIIM